MPHGRSSEVSEIEILIIQMQKENIKMSEKS